MSNETQMETLHQSNEPESTNKEKLLLEQKELLDLNETLLKEMQEREYVIDLKTKKIFDDLLKYLEKDAPWGHTTATGLIMLYHNLREQKDLTKAKDWDGLVKLRAASVTIMWSMVTKKTGNGFFEARKFVELMAICGESLSVAVQEAHKDNTKLRENHHRLSTIDDQLASLGVADGLTEDNSQSIVNEVDPVTEL